MELEATSLEIFSLVLSGYQDCDHEYTPEDVDHAPDYCDFYRPAWATPRVLDWDLLLSCRQIYYKANNLNMSQATHRFFFDIRKPRNGRVPSTYDELRNVPINRLPRHNLANVTNIHIQTTRIWLESSRNFFREYCESMCGPYPFPNLEWLTITVSWAHWFVYEAGDRD